MTSPLAAAVAASPPPEEGGLRVGTIAALNPLTVQLAGGSVEQAGWLDLSGQRPLVGDVVAVLRQENAWLVLGPIAAADVASLGSPRAMIGSNVGTAAGIPAVSTGAEVAFPSSAWNVREDTYVFQPGQVYYGMCQFSPNSNTSGTALWGTIRIRKGQQTITGQILGQAYHQYPGDAVFDTTGRSEWMHFWIRNATAAAISTKLSLTIDWDLGVGTNMGLYGGDALAPTLITVQHHAAIVDAPAAVAASVAIT